VATFIYVACWVPAALIQHWLVRYCVGQLYRPPTPDLQPVYEVGMAAIGAGTKRSPVSAILLWPWWLVSLIALALGLWGARRAHTDH
jgi:hypothetical protein